MESNSVFIQGGPCLIFCGLKGGPLFGGGQLLEMGSYLRKPGMQHSSSNAVLPFRYIGSLINTQIQVYAMIAECLWSD